MSKTKLIRGNCAEVMKRFSDEVIDLTVTSPPYDNLRSYNGNNDLWGEHVWKDVIKELCRVTKRGGVVVWVVQDMCVKGSESGSSFKQALWALDCGLRLYDTMIWHKPSPQSPTEGRYYDVFEYMFVFSKGKPKTLNLLKDRKNATPGAVRNKETRSSKEDRRTLTEKRVTPEYSRRFNVWRVPRGANKTNHPAVFPEQLARDHILSWSNEVDTVFDPFMGSGTTGKIAKQLNRDFIGIELDENYFEIAKKRISEA